jgi:hypothetical protein
MEHMIHTTQEVFSKKNTFTSSQMRSHCDMIQSGLISFTAENEPAQWHVQECPIFDFTQRAIFYVILDIWFVSTSWFHSCLPCGAFEFSGVHRSWNVKAGEHVHVGPSWGHWAMTKEKGIDAVWPKNGKLLSKDLRSLGSRPKIAPNIEQFGGCPKSWSWRYYLQVPFYTNFSSLLLGAKASS